MLGMVVKNTSTLMLQHLDVLPGYISANLIPDCWGSLSKRREGVCHLNLKTRPAATGLYLPAPGQVFSVAVTPRAHDWKPDNYCHFYPR